MAVEEAAFPDDRRARKTGPESADFLCTKPKIFVHKMDRFCAQNGLILCTKISNYPYRT